MILNGFIQLNLETLDVLKEVRAQREGCVDGVKGKMTRVHKSAVGHQLGKMS